MGPLTHPADVCSPDQRGPAVIVDADGALRGHDTSAAEILGAARPDSPAFPEKNQATAFAPTVPSNARLLNRSGRQRGQAV